MKSKLDYYIISLKARIIDVLCYNKKIDEKKIVIDNFLGNGFGDNLKYIVEELKKADNNFKFIWIVRNKKEEFPKYIKKVKYGSFRSLYEYATAQIWIDNVRNNIKPNKREGQIYLQTWHGPFSSKKIEKLAEGSLSTEYVKLAQKDGMLIDGILSNSEMQDEQYKKYFWLNDDVEILKFGFPRNDYLINNKDDNRFKKNIKDKLNLSDNYYLILYAPTFRDDFSIDGYKLDFENILLAFEKKYKRKCKILIRLHPNVQKYSKVINYNENIINVTSYPNMQDLALVCDSVISDYSSTLFDFAIQKKPAFICALDLEHYINTRGLVDEYFKYPFPFAKNSVDLQDNIFKFDYYIYQKELEDFFDKHPIYDKGDATKKIKKWILNKSKKGIVR